MLEGLWNQNIQPISCVDGGVQGNTNIKFNTVYECGHGIILVR